MKTPPVLGKLAAVLGAAILTVGGCKTEDKSPPPLTSVIYAPAPAPTGAPPPPPLPAVPRQTATATPVESSPAPAAEPSAAKETPALEQPLATLKPQRPPLPATVAQVVDMAHGAVDDTVLLEFIKNSTNGFNLSSDQIVYLKDVGLSNAVIVALVQHGSQLLAKGAPVSPPVSADPAAVELPPSVATPLGSSPTPEALVAPPSAETPTPVAASAPPAPTYAGQPPAPDQQSPPQPTVTQVPPPVQPATVTQPIPEETSYWYSSLAPYGSWMYLPSYGWCWQPTCAAVSPGWQPYCNGGRWLWTDAGWYWNSTYSWGWAPFHYGRWYSNPSCGWVWVPGAVWGPAWVTWRTCDAYWGWAPLPPEACWTAGVGLTWYGSGVSLSFGFNLGWGCYNFVPAANFCNPYPYRCAVPRAQVANVYNNTTVINNYVVGNNNTVVNQGAFAPTQVTKLTRQEVPKARLEDVPARGGAAGPTGPSKPERLSSDGSKLAVYRPAVPTRPGGEAAKSDSMPQRRYQEPMKLASPNLTAPGVSSRRSTEGALATTPAPTRGKAVSTSPGVATPTHVSGVPTAPSRNAVAVPTKPGSAVPTRGASTPGTVRTTLPERTPNGSTRATTEVPRQTMTPATSTSPPASRNATPASQPSPSGGRGELRKVEAPPASGAAPKFNPVLSPTTVTRPVAPAAPYSSSAYAPATPARPSSATPTAPERSFSPQPAAAPSYNSAPPARSFSPPAAAPSYSTPPARQFSPPAAAPSYSAPPARSFSPPAAAPSYSAPPARSFSPPAASPSAPADGGGPVARGGQPR